MEFSRIYKIRILAEENLYRSVISINKNLEKEERSKDGDYLAFGVKNTSDISLSLLNKLKDNPKYLFTTVDKMSHLGRSVDTDLHNPLTYRLMTGSSSGTCVNILKGINDFGIGTDGGGSVLAPAISTNLYSFIGSGIELLTEKENLSTDKITFNVGLGIITKDFKTLKKVSADINDKNILPENKKETEINLDTSDKINKVNDNINLEGSNLVLGENNILLKDKIRVIIPKEENLILPDKIDMRFEIDKIIKDIPKEKFSFIEYNFKNIYEREYGIEEINNIFENDLGDLILTYEGPIDVYGYDETIQRSFKGIAEKEITSNGGKALVKAANMCKCTGITIPGDKLASGFVIIGKKGYKGYNESFALAEEIDKLVEKNEIFQRYFIERKKFVDQLIY